MWFKNNPAIFFLKRQWQRTLSKGTISFQDRNKKNSHKLYIFHKRSPVGQVKVKWQTKQTRRCRLTHSPVWMSQLTGRGERLQVSDELHNAALFHFSHWSSGFTMLYLHIILFYLLNAYHVPSPPPPIFFCQFLHDNIDVATNSLLTMSIL